MTTDDKKITLTVKVLIVMLIFIITTTATAVTMWVSLGSKVAANCLAIEEMANKSMTLITELETVDGEHMRLINQNVKTGYQIQASLAGLEKDIGYITIMIEEIKEQLK